jgi:aspartate/glutamate racemase
MNLSQLELFANKLSRLLEEVGDAGYKLIAIETDTPHVYLDLADSESRTPISSIPLFLPENAPLYSFLTDADEE